MKSKFKQSMVGNIPADWELVAFANLFEFRNGVNADRASYGQGVRFINVLEPITYSHIHGHEITGKVSLPESVISSYAVQMGDVLFNRTSETQEDVALAATYLGNERVVFGGFVIRGRPIDRRLDPLYSGYALRAPIIRSQIVPMGQGAVRANVGQQNLGLVVVPVPPLPEQRAIARALCDVDTLLAGLDRLIAKKRDLKQAAMQQLLTGQTRLPGFQGKWQETTLGKLGQFMKGRGVTKDQTRSGNLPCIRYGELYTHHNNVIKTFNSWISPEVAASAVRLRKGDILFAGSGETKEEIGKCAAFISEVEAYAGGDIIILRPLDAHAEFLGYFLNTAQINNQKASRGQGDAVVHISSISLADIPCRLPSYTEQAAIASILSDIDVELSALEQRRAKTLALKYAMMQELLTGKTRLIEKSATAFHVISIPEVKPLGNKRARSKSHNWQINEAVVVSVLVKHFGTEQFPLGRKRCTKLAYLMHRHVENVAEGYLKKAAGPYNPSVKYSGPEKIAQENGYIRPHTNGKYSGYVAAKNISKAEAYFDQWYGGNVLVWLEQFRFESNDNLELLATVDMAMEDLWRSNAPVNIDSVKSVIRNHPAWEAKLDREIFSDTNISLAITKANGLFPLSGATFS